MTPPPGYVRSSTEGGLRIVIEGNECILDPQTAADLLYRGYQVPLCRYAPSAARHGFDPGEIGHITPSAPDGAEAEHLILTINPGRAYLALAGEVREVLARTRDICKVVGE